jgi:hypothetical protein
MITCLIRTIPGREKLFKKAWLSAEDQWVVVDYIYSERVNDYSYNLLCNLLKDRVRSGYFFFLDDDDYLIPGAIEKIRPHLEPGKALIVQMLRNGVAKPARAEIVKGRIGLPCMILHHSHKNIADVEAHEYGDYSFIKNVCDKIPWKFVPIPVVNAGRRNHGK